MSQAIVTHRRFISLEGGEFVLTLVERGPRADMPFFIELLERLHQAGLPVPYAVPTQSGEALRELAGKPALLQPRLAGKHVSQPNAHHCAEIGAWLARLHLATREQILDRVWGYDFGGESNVLEVYIRYLRQKTEAANESRLIHTVRSVGYVMREE